MWQVPGSWEGHSARRAAGCGTVSRRSSRSSSPPLYIHRLFHTVRKILNQLKGRGGVAYIWDSVQRKKYCFRSSKNVKFDILCSNENVFFHLHDDNILQSTSITAQFILLLTFIGNRRQRAHESYQTTTTTYYGYLTIFDIIFCGVISRQRNCCRKRPFRLFLMKLLNYNCINPLCFAKEHKKQ